MKIWLAPESAIASFDEIVNAAYAHFNCCASAAVKIGGGNGNAFLFLLSYLVGSAGATEENAVEKLEVDPDKTFDVTTVMSSLSTTTLLTRENIIVGSNVVLITENVSLHLNTTLPSIAPNHHIVRNTVLWRIFVLHPYPALMYCWAFCHVKYLS